MCYDVIMKFISYKRFLQRAMVNIFLILKYLIRCRYYPNIKKHVSFFADIFSKILYLSFLRRKQFVNKKSPEPPILNPLNLSRLVTVSVPEVSVKAQSKEVILHDFMGT